MRQIDAEFVLRNYKTSKANLPDTVPGSRLSTYCSVAESLAGWLTTGFSLAIPPSCPGSASYCCLLWAMLVNNSCKRVRPVYSPVTPRSTELSSARSFQETNQVIFELCWTHIFFLDLTPTDVHGTSNGKTDILRAYFSQHSRDSMLR